MNRSSVSGFLLAALIATSFAVGWSVRPAGEHSAPARLQAQGRGARPPARKRRPLPPPKSVGPLVYGEESGQASAANGFLAVTGSYGVGTSVLYLIDTVRRQLAVYEARGGSAGSRRVYLVGARRIDLDLQLRGYNDESEYDYVELQRLFERQAKSAAAHPAPPAKGAAPIPPGGPRGK